MSVVTGGEFLQTHMIQLCCMPVGVRSFGLVLYELLLFYLYSVQIRARRFTDMRGLLSPSPVAGGPDVLISVAFSKHQIRTGI